VDRYLNGKDIVEIVFPAHAYIGECLGVCSGTFIFVPRRCCRTCVIESADGVVPQSMHGKHESYERPRKARLPTPDWWTAVFSGILAMTAVGALWYARDQIKETRDESEVQIKESRQQAQIQHLITLVNQFDQEPMATYRRGLAQKRLSNKDSDPDESYRVLDFFETVGLLVNRG
jgi:hypothetical protein